MSNVFTTPKNLPISNEFAPDSAPAYQAAGTDVSDLETDNVSDVPEMDGQSNVQELPDGGMLVNFGDQEAGEGPIQTQFSDNLASVLDEGDLVKLSTDLVQAYEADKRSRTEWEKTYKEGLPLLGFNIEKRTEPWANACGVYHPVMAEAAVRFVSSAMTESFPAKGPVKTVMVGKWTREKEKKSKRVQEEMNYQLTEVMKEYRQETEQAIWRMSIAGSAFKKIYYDEILKRPAAMCVYPEHLVVPYGASHLETTERFTHELFYTENQVEVLQASGVYRGVELGAPVVNMSTQIDTAKEKISGVSPSVEVENRHELLEMYVDLVLDDIDDAGGLPCPYIITIDKNSNTVLSIYRNWDEQDPLRKKIMNFVHYQYMPGFGFYGLGLINVLGGMAKAATSMLRQLVDAGTLSNLRAGYKTRGLRVKGDNKTLSPGELRDVDVLSGALKDNIYFPDFRGPSAELAQLLGNMVEEARRLGSVADMKVSEVSGEMPVGTILAIFERNMKVQSAIQARLHASLKEEFKILARLISIHSARYDYEIDNDPVIIKQDFDPHTIDIFPVSDPNASTMSMRMIQHQAVMEMSVKDPGLYDKRELHLRALDIMGIKDAEKILPDKSTIPALDPISENMAILTGQPVKAYPEQDHESHIKIHMAMAQDPSIIAMMEKSPNAQSAMAAMSSHVQEHIAFAYRNKIQQAMGVELPPPGQPLPPDIEYNLSKAVAEAAETVLNNSKAEIAQKANEEAAKDPMLELQKREADLKEMDIQRKIAKDKADIEIKDKGLTTKTLTELARQASTERAFKAEQTGKTVQNQAEEKLRHNDDLFRRQQHVSSIGAGLLDTLIKEESKKHIAKISKKPLPE